MNILGWTIGKAETRQANYTDAITQALQSILEQKPARADALAVVESCVSLIADPLLVATTIGLPLPSRMLYTAARDVLREGNSVWVIDTSTGVLQLHRAYKWDIRGTSPNPATWEYDLDINVPSGTMKGIYSAARVVHLRLASLPGADWIGQAPWQTAAISGQAMAEIERGIRDEGRTLNGRIWTLPDGGSQAQADAMARTIRLMAGGGIVVAETTAGGFGGGKAAAPKADWTPIPSGQQHTLGNQATRDSVEASIAAAYGVPSAYLNANATAPALREVKRLAYLNRTLPLTALMVAELREKIDPLISITWPNLADQSIDVHLRARAAAAVATAELITDTPALLELVGLPTPMTSSATNSTE